MPEVHVLQWAVAFAGALWLTARWLLSPPAQRWRHIVAGLIVTVLWIPVAYTAGNVGVSDSGETVAFGSTALGYFGTFMVVASIAGLLVGLVLWIEAEADEASQGLPQAMRRGQE